MAPSSSHPAVASVSQGLPISTNPARRLASRRGGNGLLWPMTITIDHRSVHPAHHDRRDRTEDSPPPPSALGPLTGVAPMKESRGPRASDPSPFHEGERTVQRRTGVRDRIETIEQRLFRDF